MKDLLLRSRSFIASLLRMTDENHYISVHTSSLVPQDAI